MDFNESFGVTITPDLIASFPGSSDDIVKSDAGGVDYDRDKWLDEVLARELFDYDGWISTQPEIGPNNGFFESVSDCRDWCNGHGVEPPAFAFCCRSDIPQLLDYDELVDEQIFVDSFDDARYWVGLDEENAFRDAINRFNEHISGILTYYPDLSRKVRVKQL